MCVLFYPPFGSRYFCGRASANESRPSLFFVCAVVIVLLQLFCHFIDFNLFLHAFQELEEKMCCKG